MKAAVVHAYGQRPVYEDVEAPVAEGSHQRLVDVSFTALSRRVLSQAAGQHYTSTDDLPLVPGIDGVGRDHDGTLRYFVLPDTTRGALAEQVLIDDRRSVVLPDDVNLLQVAVAMNPVMSSWLAFRHRAHLNPGEHVLVLGATGISGRLAIQVSRMLGASHVTAVGRGLERLQDLGADAVVALDQDPARVTAELADAGSSVDVVLDYLWGQPTADALRAIVPARADDEQRLSWVQIGSIAGAECPVPSAALRATNLRILGSGQGSVSPRQILADLADIAAAITDGSLVVPARVVPLAEIEQTWDDVASSTERIAVQP